MKEYTPAALRNKKAYDGKIYTTKELIEHLILKEGFINKEVIKNKSYEGYKLSNLYGRSIIFRPKASKKYIDEILLKTKQGAKVELEHKATIEKIKKPGIKTKDAAAMIAADHIAEDKNYYEKLDEVKLEDGGEIKENILQEGGEIEVNKFLYEKEVVDFSDFHISTFANYSKIKTKEIPQREPDFKSRSGSKYWYENDFVIRQSDHWGRTIASCNWLLNSCAYKGSSQGICKLSNFIRIKEYLLFRNEQSIGKKFEVGKTVLKRNGGGCMDIDKLQGTYLKESNDYYVFDNFKVGKQTLAFVIEKEENILAKGGSIQQLKEGETLTGPSHANGGIEIQVNNKPVAEAEGGEVVINKNSSKLFCEELSEINQKGGGKALNCDENCDTCEHKMECGGKLKMDITGDEFEQMAKGGKLKKEPTVISTENLSDYQTNKAIEKMIDAKGIDPANYTSDEKQYLRKYSGYGGIVADEFSLEEAKASFTEFYTPDTIVRKMWALAYKYGFKDGGNVLEPSVGTGEFLKYMPSNSMAAGYEINKYSYSICKILYPQYNFYLQPFENVFIKNRDTLKNKIGDLPKYSLVIGNPPYGDVSGIGMGMGEKQYTNAKNWIEYFILRGLDLTLPGGLLIYIIGTEVANGGTPFLQQGTNKIKEKIAERADLVDAYRLPNGVFDRTDVLSDILVFKKK